MAYQLQPGLTIVDPGTIPTPCASDFVFEYPVPSELKYCCRPSTMIYGTAPYMAGKGAPNEFIMIDDALRPQATTQFRKTYVETYKNQTFPWQNMSCAGPVRTMRYEPTSSRADMQNANFMIRYGRK